MAAGFFLPEIAGARATDDTDSLALDARARLAKEPLPAMARRFRDVARAVQPSLVRVEVFVPHGRIATSEGSGVLIDSGGTILTCYHVVRGADRIIIQTHDERRFKAQVMGMDADADLAVLSVGEQGLLPLPMAIDNSLETGDWVMAFGAPFGLSRSASAGIVSATHRRGMGLATFEDFIQTDVAINPGNSGGPLVNLQGQLVGINNATATQDGGGLGISFAIPMATARRTVHEIQDIGNVQRGWLGIELSAAKNGPGIMISRVKPDTPAEKAGLLNGQVILSIDGHFLKDVDDLRYLVAAGKPGTTMEFEILAAGKKNHVAVTLGSRQARKSRKK